MPTMRPWTRAALGVVVLMAAACTGSRSADERRTVDRVLHNLAPEADYDEHGMVRYEPGQSDLVSPLRELRDVKKPEVLFLVTSTGSDAVRILNTMDAIGYRPPEIFAFGSGFSEPQVLQAAGAAGEGLFYSSAWS